MATNKGASPAHTPNQRQKSTPATTGVVRQVTAPSPSPSPSKAPQATPKLPSVPTNSVVRTASPASPTSPTSPKSPTSPNSLSSPKIRPATPNPNAQAPPRTPVAQKQKSSPAPASSLVRQTSPRSPNPSSPSPSPSPSPASPSPQGLTHATSMAPRNQPKHIKLTEATVSPLTEKELKQQASLGEPAWKTAGKAAGIQIWRIEKFKVVEWPKDQYGNFFDSDSFIVLNTYGHPNSFKYNVHFWLGLYTSQDEAGTAAYKTVELDDYLGGLPVQYREVQGHESKDFLKLFQKIVIMKGGVDSGFRHVEPEKYRPRLMHIKGTAQCTVVREVPMSLKSLNSGDVFILDEGLKVYIFRGKDSSPAEKDKAGNIWKGIDAERKSMAAMAILDEAKEATASTDREKTAWKNFWAALGGKGPIAPADKESDKKVKENKEMYKVSDAAGKLTFTKVPFLKSSLLEDDAFVVSTGTMIFVWVGKRANANEKKSAFQFAPKYLADHPELPQAMPIVRILSGAENDEFFSYF